jgi:hypothetical protein
VVKKLIIFLMVLVFLISSCNAATTSLSVSTDPGNEELGIEPFVYGFLTVDCDNILTPLNEPLPEIWVKTADDKTPKYQVVWIDRSYIGNDKMQWEFRIDGLNPNQAYKIYGKTSLSPTVVKTVLMLGNSNNCQNYHNNYLTFSCDI